MPAPTPAPVAPVASIEPARAKSTKAKAPPVPAIDPLDAVRCIDDIASCATPNDLERWYKAITPRWQTLAEADRQTVIAAYRARIVQLDGTLSPAPRRTPAQVDADARAVEAELGADLEALHTVEEVDTWKADPATKARASRLTPAGKGRFADACASKRAELARVDAEEAAERADGERQPGEDG